VTAPVSTDVLVDRAIALLSGPRPDGAAEVGRARAVKPARPTIVVVGETKRGKSSLINALVNVPGLSPVDPQVATSTYITIQHGPQLAARAIFPGSPNKVPIEVDRLRDWATGLGATPSGQAPPRMVEVDCPSPMLQKLTLIDTPGVGGLDSAHGEIALRAAQQATALLFVVDASAPFTSHELDFLRKASESVDLVLFAVTKIDAYRGWRQIAEDDRALLKEHAPRFAEAELLPVSSRLFEQAAELPTPELAGVLRTESQIIGLQLTLQRKVAAKGAALHEANVLRAARTQLAAHYRDLALRKDAVDPDPAKVEALRADREKLVTSRRSESRTWQLKLRAEIARARMDSMHDVQREVREGLHYWRNAIDRADKEALTRLPQDVDAALHATSLRVFDRLLERLRGLTENVLRDMFAPEELEDVYAGLSRTQLTDPVAPPEARQPSVEDKIVMYGGVATGMAASRMIAYLPAMLGLGVAGVVMAPLSIGLGLAATTWMVRSRKHVAEKNHLKLWVSETLTEARAAMEAEVASQFIDAEHSLTLALDAALQRRIDTLDTEIKEIDEALRLDAQEKDKRRKELIAQQNVVRQVVAQIDQTLPGLRTGQTAAAAIATAVTGGASR
jgi:dynamin family protein